MKPNFFLGAGALCLVLMFSACQKDELTKSDTIESALVTPRAVTCSDGVTRTYPSEVCVGEEFTISAAFSCGRMAIEQQITGTSCSDVLAAWGPLSSHVCYTAGSVSTGTLAFAAPGIYRFRTQHLMNDGNCDGLMNTAGNCAFSGTNFCCFEIVVSECGCETDFSGDAIACGGAREAIYRFVHEDAQDYVKIQGGLTNFTGADAIVTVAGGSDVEITQVIQGGSSNRRITVEFAADACEEITIHITWNSTNGGGVITGDWSAKDEDGAELAPGVEGLECD
jgi:hypothetical protein